MAATNTDPQRPLFPTFVWGFILFCFFGLLAVVAVRFYGSFDTYEDQRALERLGNLAEYREQMNTKLETLAWADKETKTVQVPIAVAMEIAMKKLNAKDVAASSVSVLPPAVPAPTEEPASAEPDAAEPDAATPETTTPETTTQE